ncbi:MAG: methyltransferase domain-containing protein [Gammaproteobacteria bacterium]|nr:methyltransferase domain-containing protein [Gammaproteobacteria bacterium]
MSAVQSMVQAARRQARAKRASVFREAFTLSSTTRILDIGSEDGSAVAAMLAGTGAQPNNVYIADSDLGRLEEGHRRFGFVPVEMPESGRLPFEDRFFDIVYCSSVIEHVTVPKSEVWAMHDGQEFQKRAHRRQRQFANEIRRLGKQYYVQTPDKWFPVESHTWLPFVGYLPRSMQLKVLALSNRYWIKRTTPAWNLLGTSDMRELFPDAEIRRERFMGLSKSIMAIKS